MAACLGAAAALDAESHAPVLAGAGAAILFLGLGLSTRRSGAIPIALLLLGALHVIPDGDRSIGTVIYGSCLLLTAELAYWSIDEHGRRPVEPGVFAPRLIAILAVVAARIPASVLVLVAADVDIIALGGVNGGRSNGDRGVRRPPRGYGAAARGLSCSAARPRHAERAPPRALVRQRGVGGGVTAHAVHRPARERRA